MPWPPKDPSPALRRREKSGTPLSASEKAFVPYLYHYISKERLPATTERESARARPAYTRNKLCDLEQAQDGAFVDVVVKVVRDPFDLGDKYTLWVSDYSSNSAFFEHSFAGGRPYDGTRRGKSLGSEAWEGPLGMRSMQVTCFYPHAQVISQHSIAKDSWVMMRNLHIKFGHNNNNLEGFLREDRQYPSKIGLIPLDPGREHGAKIGEQLKAALRREAAYVEQYKKQCEQLKKAALAGEKRRASMMEEAARSVGKTPRNLKRKVKRTQGKDGEGAARAAPADESAPTAPTGPAARPAMGDLNAAGALPPCSRLGESRGADGTVKCEHANKRASSVADMLAPVYTEVDIDDLPVRLQLPFSNLNYRAVVRVVDFSPADLRLFSRPKTKPSGRGRGAPGGARSDAEEPASDSSADSAPSSDDGEAGAGAGGADEWQWRFALQLEDAGGADGEPRERLWALVDNEAAQCLLDLDASDLGPGGPALDALRDRLFLLWGDLEEHKTRAADRARAGFSEAPDDSSDDERPQPSNRPFSCCVRQYGACVREPDPARADAGAGRRWVRMYKLFGARISPS